MLVSEDARRTPKRAREGLKLASAVEPVHSTSPPRGLRAFLRRDYDPDKLARRRSSGPRKPAVAYKLALLWTIFAQIDLIAAVFRCGAMQGGPLLSRKPQCLGDEIDPLWRGALAPG
jgi:hypothetical protein